MEMEGKLVILNSILRTQGYFNLKNVPEIGLCGISTSECLYYVHCNIHSKYHSYKYSFKSLSEAYAALNGWDGRRDLSGKWMDKIFDGMAMKKRREAA